MYEKTLSSAEPGLIILMIDQSGSMSEPYSTSPRNQSKAEFAATALNRCIYEVVKSCQSGELIKDRCHIAVIGYGDGGAKVLLGGKASDMESQQKRVERVKRMVSDGAGGLVEVESEMQIWVEPAYAGGTPMAEAFKEAFELASLWQQDTPKSFPPIVINITDGEPSDMPAAEQAARNLQTISTTDGSLLLFNAHIAPNAAETILPATEPSNDETAKFIYRISSTLPDKLQAPARAAGLEPMAASRGCVFNAGAETLTKLIVFGSTGVTQAGTQAGAR